MKRFIQMFKVPAADTIALQELQEARRGLLDAEAALEQATAFVAMYEARIRRLEARTATEATAS